MKRFIDRTIILLLYGILAMLAACRDEPVYNDSGVPEEGLPATVTLNVNVAKETIGTRYAGFIPGDTETSHIGHIWIGIFNAGTGKLISQVEKGESQVANHDDNGTITFENIPLSSGTCYIVGVTNADSNQGVIVEDTGNVENSKDNLLSILRKIKTWEEFKKISFLISNPESVSRVSANFVMCGAYTEANDSHSRDFLWDEEGNPQPVYIYPDKNDLRGRGRVHLQRLDAYVKFVIKPAPELPISITPVSWQVKNLPSVSFLQERKGSCEADGGKVINAADTKKTGVLWKDYGSFENFYNNSQVYLANTFSKDRDETDHKLTGSYSFDFYQLENKHTGIITAYPSAANGNNVYNEREREFKSEENGSNTGWYKSLVTSPGSSTPSSEPSLRNNNATFVEIRVQVEYFYEQDDSEFKPVDPNNYNGGKKLIQRVANAVYTVHLGYVKYKGTGVADVNDFNCLRNTATIYNITIYGADDIRIEAQEGDRFKEIESGAEGTVTDLEEDLINLDCHYSVFNIKLSDNARENLTWRIRAPYGEEYIDMVCGPNLDGYSSPYITNLGDVANNHILDALPENQFYNWVQIVPTNGPNVIAKYPGDPRLKNRTDIPNYSTNNIRTHGEDNGVWYLEDLRDTQKFRHPSNSNNNKTTEYYYTVFIDEYVYEYKLDKTKSSMTGTEINIDEWRNYVNRDYRKLWIRLGTPNISHDGESIYSESLYMVTQESIQTFYNNNSTSGFGLEHINETYDGKNEYTADDNGISYSVNGRLNMRRYATNSDINLIFQNRLQTGRAPGTLQNNGAPEVTFYVNAHPHDHMAGGLARNRDLNNNGKIDDFEIRWYVPVIDTYLRMVLGTVSLKTPLFNLLDYARDEITAGTGTLFSHYASSDNKMIWAEELSAVSQINDYGGITGNMRCIRNLGESMTDPITDNNKVQTAYEFDEVKREVSMTYYRTAALRPETQDNLPSHFVGDIQSYPARRFKVAKQMVTNENYKPLSTSNDYIYLNKTGNEINALATRPNEDASSRKRWEATINDNIIAGGYYENQDESDKGTWRLPNINELAILKFLGLLPPGQAFISCTREYFEGRDFYYMGVNSIHEISADPWAWDPLYVICVKDVIE
ncbi:MAG: hypothetical protein J1E95_10710 [Muribaculaceae bacterium]|nr:hypothetical protein [Muribaculaceae bacterium]